MALSAIALSALFAAGPGHAEGRGPVVWRGQGDVWLRDPSVFAADGGTYILLGTRSNLIEYPDIAPGAFNAEDGVAYDLQLYSPDGQRLLRRAGFHSWGKKLYRSASGTVLITSLEQAGDFNRDAPKARGRSVHVFVPKADARRTRGGFPLDWRMRDNTPMIRSSYNADIYDSGDGRFVYIDDRQDLPGNPDRITCIRVQRLDEDLVLRRKGPPVLCPGRQVDAGRDEAGWDRARPMPSELRLEENGSLIEGGWGYASPSGQHMILYSAGAYRSESNYGGFVAACSAPTHGCRKTLTADGADVRPFIAPSSRNYTHVGRPFPVLDRSGRLVDIIFHARQRGANANGEGENDILRCMNFTPDILERFVAGGPACAFDDITGS
ncbi:hypothetical protein [Paracoccus spongiarum]|uniref:Uncharacterized protein n=1 Tax=Paracoccus spongiarum TaxID=3064387 RepID=A0ABT9JC85_9RHOB|nr:hypothetical protein [Paracoccus sp. 2205BS29-5]MDP5307413.1 hypothetical protein [Paracoccus sp. 2205BS29-5]